jgi:hypothetical protein
MLLILLLFVKDLAAAVQTAKTLSVKLTPAEVKAKLGEGILNSYLSSLKGTRSVRSGVVPFPLLSSIVDRNYGIYSGSDIGKISVPVLDPDPDHIYYLAQFFK